MPADPEARFRADTTEVTFTVIDGEAILINLASGTYYSMAGVAVEAWQLLQAGHSATEIGDHLSKRYGLPTDAAAADVARLVDQLVEEKIVQPREEPPGDVGSLPDRLPDYTPPALNVYSDMADLLALDPPAPGLLDNLMTRPVAEDE